MFIRKLLPSDLESWVAIHNAVVVPLAGHHLLTVDEARRRTTGPMFDPGTHFFAEVENHVVGHASFDATSGQVSYPVCLPGYESLAHPLFTAVLRAMAERKIPKAFAAYRHDWQPVWDFFEDHDFVKTREMMNYTQSIGDLPTMFQRPGLNIATLKPDDLHEIEAFAADTFRFSGQRLIDYFTKNVRLPADAIFVLRRRDGRIKGVGLMIDDATMMPVEETDPTAPSFRFGAFGTEGIHCERVNGLFSFLAPAGNEAELIGQDLLWYATSRADHNSFETLAAQVPSDVGHLVNFYNRYFRKAGSFPIYEREVGSGSAY